MDSSLSTINFSVFTQDEKNTRLLNATKAGDVDKVEICLQAGAAIEATDEYGYTALIWAACSGHTAVVAKLIEQGANIKAIDPHGDTALITAANDGHAAVVAQLIAAGANIEAAGRYGHTALMLAARENYQNVGFLLLNALSSERVNILLNQPNLTPFIQSFHLAIARAKIYAIQAYMLMFSHKEQQRIPLELMNPILAFKFPAWLSSREDLKIEEIPALKRLLGGTPKAVISAAEEESLVVQAPVPVTFRHSAAAAAAADEQKEEGPSTKKHKSNR